MLSRAQIKYIHSLRLKKYRQRYNRFTAEGSKVVDELLKADSQIIVEVLYVSEEWIKSLPPGERRFQEVKVVRVTPQELSQISNLDTSHQSLALCKTPDTKELPNLSGKISLALETIQDPGNMGTMIRIADWFGIENVICSPDCADVFSPKTIQATMGSIARVRTTAVPLERMVAAYKNIPIYAATLSGRDIREYSPIKSGIILIGNEGHGLSNETVRLATHCITIPRIGKAESLNAAVAAGIICERLIL